MFIDLNAHEAQDGFDADVCIAGAGAAGITIALELEKRGLDVVLLESGGMAYEDETQSLYDGDIVGFANTDLISTRLRQLGGTTQHWTGLCAPLDAIDFEARAAVPNSGWPITRADLDPYYARAQPYLDLGPYNYDAAAWADKLEGAPFALDSALLRHTAYQISAPTRFGEKYVAALQGARRIRCLLHANVIDIRLRDGTDAVESVTIATLSGRRSSVRAKRFVVACGGIENARVLLNCRSQRPAGLGNEHDLVGRYFKDHLNITKSVVVLADDQADVSFYQPQSLEQATVSVGLKVSNAVLRNEALLNNTAFLVPVWRNASYNDDFRNHAWLSFANIAKSLSRWRLPDRFAQNWCNAVEGLDSVFTGAARHMLRTVNDRGRVLGLNLRQDAEQAPNPDSRVLLGESKDPFGWQRAALDWKVTANDIDSLKRTHEVIGRAFGKAGLGRVRVEIDQETVDEDLYTAFHHMGTTRMHADPRKGVVDADCRVHSLANLYMAGSSVFTTGGTANPTLSIVALATRLADHLAEANV